MQRAVIVGARPAVVTDARSLYGGGRVASIVMDPLALADPVNQTRVQLAQVGQRIDNDLALLDEAIDLRMQELPWWKRFTDPVLRDLLQSRTQLLLARNEVDHANLALPDVTTSRALMASAIGRVDTAGQLFTDVYDRTTVMSLLPILPGDPLWDLSRLNSMAAELQRSTSLSMQQLDNALLLTPRDDLALVVPF